MKLVRLWKHKPAILVAGIVAISAFINFNPSLLAQSSSAASQDYVVGAGDVLEISIYENDDLNTTARVTGDGHINLPLVGDVEVMGISVSKIARKINLMYADGYLIDPQVSVFVRDFRSQKATILGQVTRPDLYDLSGQTTLLELISKAGGLKAEAGNQAIIKRRSSDKQEKVIVIDLKALIEKGQSSLNVSILDGDSIYINKIGLFYVTGEVKKADAYHHEEGTTVIQAITMAGGFSSKASPTRVKIIRKNSDGKEEVLTKVKMDTLVMPNDVIVIPESYF